MTDNVNGREWGGCGGVGNGGDCEDEEEEVGNGMGGEERRWISER